MFLNSDCSCVLFPLSNAGYRSFQTPRKKRRKETSDVRGTMLARNGFKLNERTGVSASIFCLGTPSHHQANTQSERDEFRHSTLQWCCYWTFSALPWPWS